ncbi:hypothetical protein GCM10025880_44140 [Methylorubrum aminovorans]|nr:hypothetical protein GCM10025880_44140 [Methylorubrum aminovorans]
MPTTRSASPTGGRAQALSPCPPRPLGLGEPPLTYDLVEMGEEREIDGQAWFGLWAGGHFHRIAPAGEAA